MPRQVGSAYFILGLRAAPKILTGMIPSFELRTFLDGFFVQLQPAKN
jgi:hypothetical protein